MTSDAKTSTTARLDPRAGASLQAASLTRGPGELLDFVIPLWAGIALGADATVIGLLVSLELVISVLVRPVAGWLADSAERRSWAAAGAVVYALSCAAYAASDSFGQLALAYLAAVVGGIGGSLLWVPLRAIVSESHSEDAGIFPRLLAAEETGSWVAFVAGLSLLSVVGFRGLFLLCAASCLVGAVILLRAPRRDATPDRTDKGNEPALARVLWPMMTSVAIAGLAEAAVGILLLLHLQKQFDLGVVEAAFVFLPGAVAVAVLPTPLHRLVLVVGRRKALVGASVLSASFAAALAFAPSPWVIGALWLLSGVAWAVVIPIEQAVLVEAAPGRVGRAMGLYESSGLVGGAVGAAAAGVLYDYGSWSLACAVFAAVILAGALIGPWSLNALRAEDVPGSAPQFPAAS
jgi:MFS family permease